MKKLSMIITAAVMCFGSVAHADMGKRNPPPAPVQNDDFCWGIALVGVAVLGTVVGLTAATAASKPTSYSN